MGGAANKTFDALSTGIGGVAGAAIGSEFKDSPGSQPARPDDPSKSYTPKPRTMMGGREGNARLALEEEKRRRYDAYRNTLLGSTTNPTPVGSPEPTIGY